MGLQDPRPRIQTWGTLIMWIDQNHFHTSESRTHVRKSGHGAPPICFVVGFLGRLGGDAVSAGGCPGGFDFDSACYAGCVVEIARPGPVFGLFYEAASDRVAMDVSEL